MTDYAGSVPTFTLPVYSFYPRTYNAALPNQILPLSSTIASTHTSQITSGAFVYTEWSSMIPYNQGLKDGKQTGFDQGYPAALQGGTYDDGYDAGYDDAAQLTIGVGEEIVPVPPTPSPIKPVVTILTPLPPSTANTPIVFTVVGGAGFPLRRAWVDLVLPGIIGMEVIHNGDRFGAFYANPTNTRTAYTDGSNRVGYQYTILRDGGWPVGSFPLTTSFDISAVDTIGNGT